MELTVQKKELGRLGYEFTCSLSQGEFEKKYASRIQYYKSTVAIKGFRKGKAPQSYIEKVYGDSIKAEVINEMLPDMIDEVYKKENLKPVTEAEVKDLSTDNGVTVVFEAFVEPPMPEFTYKGINTDLKVEKVTDAEVEAEIKQMLERFVTYDDIADDGKKVAKGDAIYIDFDGFLEGDKPIEGGSAKNYLLNIGEGMFIEDLETGIIGMKKGDSKRIEVTFPKDYRAKDLAGQNAYFNVTVSRLVEKKYPELTDELAKKAAGIDTVAELKTQVNERLQHTKEDQAKDALRTSVFKKFVELNGKFELPGKVLDEEIESYVKSGKTEKEARETAEDGLRSYYILHHVSRQHNIRINESLHHEIEHLSAYFGKSVDDTTKMLEKNGMLERMAYNVWEKQTLDALINDINGGEKPAAKTVKADKAAEPVAAETEEKPKRKRTTKKEEA